MIVAMAGVVWLGGRIDPGPTAGTLRPTSAAEAVRAAELQVPLDPASRTRPQPRMPGRVAGAPSARLAALEPAGHTSWWLDSGPPIEIRFGEQLVRATPARLDVGALREVEAGDRLTVTLPEIGNLDVVIQRVTSPAPDVRQLQGHLADPVESHPVTLTMGRAFAFANVTTPSGTWIAEFEDGNGWILRDDLTDRLVDHSVSDARIPPGLGEAG